MILGIACLIVTVCALIYFSKALDKEDKRITDHLED
jgi:hypothetical protein